MRFHLLGNQNQKIWDDLVRATPESGFMQSWAWSVFKEKEGQQVLRIGVWDGQTLCGGAIVYYVPSFLGASVLEMPHGPVLPWDRPAEAAEIMKLILKETEKLAQTIHAPAVRIEPFISGALPAFTGKTVRAPLDLIPTPTLLIPLDRSEDEILKQMKEKGRYNIKQALKQGVTVCATTDTVALDDFYYLFELTFHRHSFEGEPRSFFQNMLEVLGSADMVRVYSARIQGMLVSSAIVMFFGKRATYLYGGNLPFLPSSMASYALHWKAMQDARAAGCTEYDFYGIVPDGQASHPYARFSQFKLRFGGKKTVLVGAQDIYFYPQLAQMWARSIESLHKEETLYGNITP